MLLASSTATSQPAAFKPERRRHGLLEHGARRHQRRAVGFGEPRQRGGDAVELGRTRSSAPRATSIDAVSMTSWLVAPQWT
jgi:hypothetical protein